jgi:uridylate kinase
MDAPSRLLLKLSGEVFKGEEGVISPAALRRTAASVASLPVETAIVVGGGNILRGARSPWLDRVEADTLGMLATLLNALALRSALETEGRDAVVQSAVATQLTEPVSPWKARQALADGAVVIFAGGTGNPLVTTDTAAAVRAVSIRADLLVKGSTVPGVFTKDPRKSGQARQLDDLSFDDYLSHRYGVMDLVAVEICREHNLPIVVYDFSDETALPAIASGKRVGTLIRPSA